MGFISQSRKARISACLAATLMLLAAPLFTTLTAAGAARPAGIGHVYNFAYSKSKTYSITLVKLVDPGKLSSISITPGKNSRFVGVKFKIVNTGKVVIDVGVAEYTYVVDTSGASVQFSPATLSNCPTLGSGTGTASVAPGSFIIGCIPFQIPNSQKVKKVEFGSSVPVVWNV